MDEAYVQRQLLDLFF